MTHNNERYMHTANVVMVRILAAFSMLPLFLPLAFAVETNDNALAHDLLPIAEKNKPKSKKTGKLALKAKPDKTMQPVCEIENCNKKPTGHPPVLPLAVRISDALTRQDKQTSADILEHERISLNDEMNLLSLTGRTNEAADVGFILMERSNFDEALYEQAAPLLTANSRTSGILATYRTFESYNSIATEANTLGLRLGKLKLDLAVHSENRSNNNTTELTGVTNERGGEIALHQAGENYVNTLKLQTSQSLNMQTGMSFNHQHQIGARLKLGTLLAYNQASSENAVMRLIGRSDYFALESSYTIDRQNQFSLAGGYHQYHSVDNEELGNASLLTSRISHDLSNSHPALRLHITGTLNQFKTADKILGGLTASVIPAGVTNSAAFFMPQDVSEIAAYISAGDATDSKLPARSFEYEGELGVFENPVSGAGWRASAGMAGRIIGADRLHLFVRYDQSPNGQGFSSTEAGLAYQLIY